MRFKHLIGLVLIFALAFGFTAGLNMSAFAGLEDPGRDPDLCDGAPGDYWVVEGRCCDAPWGGSGVWTGTGCRYEDNISCSCSGLLGPPPNNPKSCPLICGTPQ